MFNQIIFRAWLALLQFLISDEKRIKERMMSMSVETLRKYCNLCGSPLGETVEKVSADLL